MFSVLKTINQLRRFLEMVNYYHRFLPHGATILQPLNSLLTHSKKTLVMTEEAVRSFNGVKAALERATLLAHPRAGAQLTFTTDASSTAVGASLQQTVGGVLQPRAFFSKKHVNGKKGVVADALSKIEVASVTADAIDFMLVAEGQRSDDELSQYRHEDSSLRLQDPPSSHWHWHHNL
nr:unnamed protein product [Spirometra erinaceieuropaei]